MTRPCGAYCRAACSPQSLVSPYRLAGSPTSAVETYTRRAPCRAAAAAETATEALVPRARRGAAADRPRLPAGEPGADRLRGGLPGVAVAPDRRCGACPARALPRAHRGSLAPTDAPRPGDRRG